MSMDKICLPIQQDLASVEGVLKRETTSSVEIITQVIQFMIANKGKRLRPALTILDYESVCRSCVPRSPWSRVDW